MSAFEVSKLAPFTHLLLYVGVQAIIALFDARFLAASTGRCRNQCLTTDAARQVTVYSGNCAVSVCMRFNSRCVWPHAANVVMISSSP